MFVYTYTHTNQMIGKCTANFINPLNMRTSSAPHLSCRPPLAAEKDGSPQATTELAGRRHMCFNIYQPGKIQKTGDPYLYYFLEIFLSFPRKNSRG